MKNFIFHLKKIIQKKTLILIRCQRTDTSPGLVQVAVSFILSNEEEEEEEGRNIFLEN